MATGAELAAFKELGNTGATAIPALGKTVIGAGQVRAGQKLRERYDRPVYERPEEADRALSTAEMLAYTDMPGKQQYINEIQGRTANVGQQVAETGQDSASKLKALTGLYQGELDTMNDLATAEAGFRMDAMRNYENALMDAAGYTDKEFLLNRMEPYENAMLAASELTGAGLSNVMAGMEDLGSAYIMGDEGEGDVDMSMYDQYSPYGAGGQFGTDYLGNSYNIPNVG